VHSLVCCTELQNKGDLKWKNGDGPFLESQKGPYLKTWGLSAEASLYFFHASSGW
jgi:hypothetical protein